MHHQAEHEVLPGVPWGHPEEVFTPAFWAALGERASDKDGFVNSQSCLRREICFCLLGGYGIRAEVNRAAFERLSKAEVFKIGARPTARAIERFLRSPLVIESKKVRYRFPRQRALRLSQALRMLDRENPPNEPLELREWLLKIPGIGLKTASWIVRNHLGSDDVAILDVHIIRACQLMKVFDSSIRLPRDYPDLERRFLTFARAIGVKPSLLDAVMWREMRSIGYLFK